MTISIYISCQVRSGQPSYKLLYFKHESDKALFIVAMDEFGPLGVIGADNEDDSFLSRSIRSNTKLKSTFKMNNATTLI